MMLFIERDQDFAIRAADRCSVASVVKGFRTETNIVDDQLDLICRDGLPDLIFYLAEENFGGFDASSGFGPYV